MKKKLLAVMLAVFMAATALPETAVMAAVGPGPAEEALVQTEDKNYRRDLEDRGISDIVRYGIAFSGKNVEVRMAR